MTDRALAWIVLLLGAWLMARSLAAGRVRLWPLRVRRHARSPRERAVYWAALMFLFAVTAWAARIALL